MQGGAGETTITSYHMRQVFEIKVHVVERYSSRVLVEASSAKEARALLEDDLFNNGSSYVFDKTTEDADRRTIILSRPAAVPPDLVSSRRCSDITLNL